MARTVDSPSGGLIMSPTNSGTLLASEQEDSDHIPGEIPQKYETSMKQCESRGTINTTAAHELAVRKSRSPRLSYAALRHWIKESYWLIKQDYETTESLKAQYLQ